MEQGPTIQENPKQELTRELLRLKNEYKNGIPSEIKHSTSKDSGWKVQRGWFQGIASVFSRILYLRNKNKILLSKEFFDELFEWNEKLGSKDNPFKNRLTVQTDIDEAERMIDRVIVELEN